MARTGRLLVENLRRVTSRWGWTEYGLLLALWLMMAAPFFIRGLGFLSFFAPVVIVVGALAIGAGLAWTLTRWGSRVSAPPPVVETWRDSTLGSFERRAGSDEFVGMMTWRGHALQLRLSPGEFATKETVAALATDLSNHERQVDAAVGAFLVAELLDCVNQEWRPENVPAIDAAGFLAAISLHAVTLYGDGYYDLMFDAGDLLGGHWVEVLGSLEGGPVNAEIVG